MNVTHEDLVQAFADWEGDVRRDPSKFANGESVAAMDIQAVAEASAGALMEYLRRRRPTGAVTTVKRELLDRLYTRLSEVRHFMQDRKDHLQRHPPAKVTVGKGGAAERSPHMTPALAAYEASELALDCTINDYLRLHGTEESQ